ncbi:MAG: hypothetical protein LBG18_05080 [Mediterranea sp.]|jgi:hypothetical protein|nr:hypothetical protein [Mediterranea sp.]
MIKAETRKLMIAVFLLSLFIGYQANITFFVHTHVVNGQMITHSHLYRGTPDNPGHGHTTAQIQTIADISLLLTTGIFIAVLSHFLSGKRTVRNLSVQYACGQRHPRPYSLRAPPAR